MVTNLDPRLTEDDIDYFFEQVGITKRVNFSDDYDEDQIIEGEKSRTAIVTYKKVDEAKRAVEYCNGFKLLKYKIHVEHYTGTSSYGNSGESHLDLEGADDQGIRLDGATRMALMNRLSHRPLENLPLAQGKHNLLFLNFYKLIY